MSCKKITPGITTTIAFLLFFLMPSSGQVPAFMRGVSVVDYSTGVVSTSIPLMTISDRDISASVSLTNDGTGIKVSQEASSVGLGWLLDAGGVIVRDAHGGIYDSMNNLYGDFSAFDFNNDKVEEFYKPHPTEDEAKRLYTYFSDGREVNSPDIFSFAFCGISGKFFLDYDGDIHRGYLMSYDELDILLYDDNTFKIRDSSGVEYVFSSLKDHDQDELPSVWYLTEMKSPQGGRIEFHYVDGTYRYYGRTVGESIFENGYSDINTIDFNSSTMRDKYNVLEYKEDSESYMQLKGISTSRDSIIFDIEHSNRLDCIDGEGCRVNRVTKYNSLGNKVKEYKFEYNYFTSYNNYRNYIGNRTSVIPIEKDYSSIFKRFRLNKIVEMSPKDGQNGNEIVFSYYGDSRQGHFPNKLAPQDHYGYSNGYTDVPCEFLYGNKPETSISDRPGWYMHIRSKTDRGLAFDSIENREFRITSTIDRSPDGEYAKYGSLKRMSYSDGSWTEYDYELHDAFFGSDSINRGGVRIKSIEDGDGSGKTIKRNYTYKDYYWFQGYTGDTLSYRYYTVVDPECTGMERYRENYEKGYYMKKGATFSYTSPDSVENMSGVLPTKIVINSYPVPSEYENCSLYTLVTESIEGGGKREFRFSRPNDSDIRSQIEEACPFYRYNTLFLLYGKNESTGKKTYKTVSKDVRLGYGDFPYLRIPECPWAYGDLEECTVYDKTGKKTSSTRYEYEHKLLKAIPSCKIAETGEYMKFEGLETLWSGFYCVDYVISGMSRLKAKHQYNYDPSGNAPLTTSTLYDYGDSIYISHPTCMVETGSDGIQRTSSIYYAGSYSPSDNGIKTMLDGLKSGHIVVPIDMRTVENGRTVGGRQIRYNKSGQPTAVYSFTKGNGEFDHTKPYTFSKTLSYRYHDGFMIEEKHHGSNETFNYIWNYAGQYPYVKIFNYEQTTGTQFNASGQINIETLKAPYIYYEYIPSVGLSSMRNTDGSRELYEYDNFYRLKKITRQGMDGNSKVLKEYSYDGQ